MNSTQNISFNNKFFNLVTIITDKNHNNYFKHNSQILKNYTSIKEDEKVALESLKEFVPDYHYNEFLKAIPNFDQVLDSWHFDLPLVKDKTLKWYRLNFSTSRQDNLQFHYGQMTDISDLIGSNVISDNDQILDWINYTNEAVFCQEFEGLDLDLPLKEKIDKLYQGIYTRANDHFIELRGGQISSDVIGKTHLELFNGRSEEHDKMFDHFLHNNCRIDNYLAQHITPKGYRYFHNTVKGVVEDNKLLRVWGSFIEVTNLIENQEQVEELNEQLSIVSRLGKIGGWETDLETFETKASDEFYRLYEIDKNIVIDAEYQKQFYTEKDYNELMELNQKLIENDTQYVRTYPIIVNDITKFIEHTAYVKRNDDGKPIKIFGSVQDVTETITNHNELIKTNDYLNNITNNSSFFIIRTDMEGNYTYVNDFFAESFGVPQDKIIGDHYLKSIDPKDHLKAQQTKMKAIADPGTSFYVTLRKPKKEGVAYTHWEFICLTDLSGNPFEIQSIGLDISSIKEAEEKIITQKSMLDEMGKLAHVGAWEVYLDSGKVYWSDEVYRIYGLEVGAENNIQVGISHYHEDSQPIIEKAFNECLSEGKPFNVELKFNDVKGKEKWVRAHGVRINDEDGKPISVRGAFQDITSLKRHQVSLLEANKRLIATSNQFQKLYNDTPAMMLSLDENNKIIAISEYCLETLGFTRKEILGKRPQDLIARTKIEVVDQCLLDLRGSGSIQNIEVDFIKKDGSVIHCLLSGIIDNHDFLNRALMVIADITERKKAQTIIEDQIKELEFSNKQFINLYNLTPTMLQSLNKDGVIVNVSDFWLDKMNFERSEVIGNEFISFLEPSQKEKGKELIKKIFSNAHVEEEIIKLKSKDGRIIIGSLSSIRISDEGSQRTHSVIQDITEKKNYLELIESQNLQLLNFKAALDSHLLVSFINTKGDIIEVNEKYEKNFGYSKSEIVGKSHRIVNSGYHPPSFWEELWNTISVGEKWRSQIRNQKKDGSHYWIDTIIIPVFNLSNEIEYFLEVSSDITLFKNYEIELKEMVKERTEALVNNNNERVCFKCFKPRY